VHVLHRGNKADPVIVLDGEGKYVRSWGKGLFGNPHGLRIGRDDHVWITDTGHHLVMEFTPTGELRRTLGTKGQAGATETTFNRPTDVAFLPSGDFFVTDGYGNSRVVKFSRDGKYLKEWGRRGAGLGEFDLPHAAVVDSRGILYVSDRENNRIQIFDSDGKQLGVWTHLGATQGIDIGPGDDMWIITHRNNVENLSYDTLAGRIMRIEVKTGRILGSMESPGHWLALGPGGEIFIASLTGNVFRWRPGWAAGLREQAPSLVSPR
jgi:DNA-binding beta-propeller fold protein YncE